MGLANWLNTPSKNAPWLTKKETLAACVVLTIVMIATIIAYVYQVTDQMGQ
jgi:hypothetical protein